MSTDLLWIEQLETAAEHLRTIPLWGGLPPFPWDILSSNLKDLFDLSDLSIEATEGRWRSAQELEEGLGEHPLFTSCVLSPLEGHVTFALPQKSAQYLLQLLLTQDHKLKSLAQDSIFEGFSHFLFLYLIDAFNQAAPYGNLQASLLPSSFSKKERLGNEGAFCMDISIDTGKWPLWVRLICKKETHKALEQYFQKREASWIFETEMTSLPIPLHLSVGSVTLSAHEIAHLRIGDLVLLDQSLFDPTHQKGAALLYAGETSLFTMRMKEGEVKIIDYALSKESSSPLYTPKHKESRPMNSSHEETDPLQDQSGDSSNSLLGAEDLPISITIELARLTMPLGKLSQLKPGNVLDLPLQGQDGVYLTVSGKRIAKAELVKLGEVVGAKILSIGE